MPRAPADFTGVAMNRAWRDEARCRAKYGAAWDVFRATVPARIVPGVW